jgi:dienelactone hydrolase
MSENASLSKKVSIFLICCLFGILIGSLGIARLQAGKQIIRQEINFSVAAGQREIRASVFRPLKSSQKLMPGVVLVHGVLVNREYMTFFAQGLARQGLAVLSLDLGGYGESDPRPESESENLAETLEAINQLRQLPGVDNNRIALAGHSMGGTTVLQALSNDPTLRGGVVLGMEPESSQQIPCRVWFGLGLYDAFHPPDALRAKLPTLPQPNCEQILFVSPAASHQSEMRDPHLLTAASQFLAKQLDHQGRAAQAIYSEFWLSLASELYALAWISLAVFLLWRNQHGWGELIGISLVLGGLLLAGQMHWLPPLQMAPLSLLTLLLISLRKHLHSSDSAKWKMTLGLLVSFWLAHETVTLSHALGSWWQKPTQILWLPLFLVQEIRVLPQTGLQMGQALLFETYTQNLQPAWPLIALVILEVVKPGWAAGCLLNFSPALAQRLNHSDSQAPPKHLIWVFLALLGLLGVLLWQRAESGFLHAGALRMLWQHGVLHLLPTLVLALLLFRLAAQKMGTCPRDDSNVRPTI